MLKPKIPYHLRELVYNHKEAIDTSGMSERTFYRYLKEEPFTVPYHIAFITNWVRRSGFPKESIPYGRDIQHRVEDAHRLRREGMKIKEIATRLGCVQRTIHRYLNRSEYASS